MANVPRDQLSRSSSIACPVMVKIPLFRLRVPLEPACAPRHCALTLLVRDLVRGGAKTTELSRILAADAHPPHGPCSIEVASAADSFANGSGRLTTGRDGT